MWHAFEINMNVIVNLSELERQVGMQQFILGWSEMSSFVEKMYPLPKTSDQFDSFLICTNTHSHLIIAANATTENFMKLTFFDFLLDLLQVTRIVLWFLTCHYLNYW